MRRFVMSMFLVALTFPWPVHAQANGAVKIGFVDLDRALQQLPQAQRAVESLNHELEIKQKDLDSRREKIQQFQAEMEKQGASLSETQKREKERQLQNMVIGLQRLQRESQDELTVKRNQALKEMQDRILRVVSAIGQRGGYTMIVHDKAVVYVNRSIDLTDQVIAELKTAKK